jgi:flagellar basal-body rod protein FlgB
MIKSIFRHTQLPLIEKILDIASQSQQAVAANIANLYTPGYRSRHVDFAGSLNEAMNTASRPAGSTDPLHIPVGQDSEGNSEGSVIREGGKPDLEKEMALSAENQLIYSAAAKILSSRFKSIKACIRGHF